MQSVNQELLQVMLAKYFAKKDSPKPTGEQPKITPDELNAMQYVCGYVPHKLLKKYETRKGEKSRRFVECLGNMAVVSEDCDPDLLSYTRLSFEKVNRGGGLFTLSLIFQAPPKRPGIHCLRMREMFPYTTVKLFGARVKQHTRTYTLSSERSVLLAACTRSRILCRICASVVDTKHSITLFSALGMSLGWPTRIRELQA